MSKASEKIALQHVTSRHADQEPPQAYNEPLYGRDAQALEAIEGSENDADDDLDSGENLKILRWLEDHWYQARTVHAEPRLEMARDEEAYDGDQWTPEEKIELAERGQPAYVYNEIRESVNWVIGTERRSRMDFSVHPRTEDDVKPAQTKEQLLKYVDDVNKGGFARSQAFADSARVGVGWLEDGIRSDPFDEPLYSGYESWRNMWFDHLDLTYDLSKSRYLFRAKWTDVDIAEKMWTQRAAKIRQAAEQNNNIGHTDDDELFYTQLYYNDATSSLQGNRNYVEDANYAHRNRRQRVRLIEAWYRMPVRGGFMFVEDPRHARFNQEQFSEQNDMHQWLVKKGYASVFDAIRMKVYQTVFIDGALLQAPSCPYRHDKFPFTPVWAYRRKRDGMPYGLIRNMLDPQFDLNKRRSKAIFLLSTNQVEMEQGAVDDIEELREEVARPDGIIIRNRGKELKITRGNELAVQHLQMEQANKDYIRQAAGVTPENLGHQTNAVSGKAIEARQSQGTVSTAELFDNYRFGFQLQGEKRLSLIEQFYSNAKKFRILGKEGRDEFVSANMPIEGEDGQDIENPITQSQADFVVDEQDFRESMRIAMFEQLLDMVGRLPPEIALQLLDLVVDMSDVPGREHIVARIRKVNGQPDPNMEDDPEAQAEQQARDEAEAEQADLSRKSAIAEVDKSIAEAKSKRADSMVKALESMKKAMEIAMQMRSDPAIAPMIDGIMEAGKEELGELPQQP